MPVFFDSTPLTPAERRARTRAIRAHYAAQSARFNAWLRHYRALGLGDLRARKHATQKAHAGKVAP